MVQSCPVTEATVAVVDGPIEVGHRVDTGEDHLSLDVHAVHHTDRLRFCIIAVQVRERPFCGEFRLYTGCDFIIACWQTGVRVIILDDVAIAVKQWFKHVRVGVPSDFFVAAGYLSYAVVTGGVPLNLLPNSIDSDVLDEGH